MKLPMYSHRGSVSAFPSILMIPFGCYAPLHFSNSAHTNSALTLAASIIHSCELTFPLNLFSSKCLEE